MEKYLLVTARPLMATGAEPVLARVTDKVAEPAPVTVPKSSEEGFTVTFAGTAPCPSSAMGKLLPVKEMVPKSEVEELGAGAVGE